MQNNQFYFHEILIINDDGLVCDNRKIRKQISFNECCKNYSIEHSLENSKCVGTRDITNLIITFSTSPETKIVFKKTNLFTEILKGVSAVRQFHQLQKEINRYGYSTFDLS